MSEDFEPDWDDDFDDFDDWEPDDGDPYDEVYPIQQIGESK